MEDVRDLKALQLDALKEVANIGAGHAATALSQLTHRRIMISVPEINIARLEEVPSLSGAYMNALSEFMGMLLLPSVPSLVVDVSAAVLTTTYLNFGHDRDFVFCVETEFNIDARDGLRGHFLLLPDLASLKAIFDAIRLT